MSQPTASIVIPLSGASDRALECLQGVALQPNEPPFEVVIVDNASVGLSSLLGGLEGDVRIIRSERRLGFGAALALGAEHATGRAVIVLRDAAVPQAGWFGGLLDALRQPATGLVASATTGQPDAPLIGAWAAAVTRADLDAAGGFRDVQDELVIGSLALAVAELGHHATVADSSLVAAPGQRTVGARSAPGTAAELTIVIPTLDAVSERVRGCVATAQMTTHVAHQIVIVDNGFPPQGFTAPVNAGIRAAATPYVVVMNDDVELLPGWWQPLRAALDAGATVVFPLTIDGAMRRDFAAWCFAMTADTITKHSHAEGEFFDPSLVVWYQDTDLLQRLREAGTPPLLVENSRIRHGLSETVATSDPKLSTWINAQIRADRQTFIAKHPTLKLHGHPLAE